MDASPIDVFRDTLNIRFPSTMPHSKVSHSIVICTYGRPESLNETLKSLELQTFKDFEVILLTEKGHLAQLRDDGLRASVGDVVSFIDDDVYCTPTWAESIHQAFKRKGVVGVTGPTLITEEYKRNRDVFKYRLFKRLHDVVFLGWLAKQPSHLSKCGCPSMYSNELGCKYDGPVDYLECCNMTVKRKEAIDAGGFKHEYIKTGEWAELDLSLRLSSFGSLYFSPSVALFHKPSKAGIYSARLNTQHRWENFMRFQKQWEGKRINRSLRTYAYRSFVWLYLKMKKNSMI